MSYIPPIRERQIESVYAGTKGSNGLKENGYWQGFLNDDDTRFLQGYDWASEQTLRNFFYNLDTYADDLARAFGIDEIDLGSDDAIAVIFNDKDMDDYSDEEWNAIPVHTRVMAVIKACLEHWMEMDRDELGTSMIDSMSETEYEQIRADVLSGKRITAYTDKF